GHEAGGIVGRGHVVKKATVGQFEASAGMDNHFFGGLLARDFFDRSERPRHVEHLAHFRFANVQGHGCEFQSSGEKMRGDWLPVTGNWWKSRERKGLRPFRNIAATSDLRVST